MKLGPTNKELFGETPRFVGLVGVERADRRDQFVAFDRTCLDLFLERNYGEHNLYTRISHIGNAGGSILDEVFLDLDVDKPDDREAWASEVIPKMRKDRMVADDILGDVVEDARKAARFLRDRDWPSIGVFSGLGIHIHALTEPAVEPSRELKTSVKMIEDHAGLETVDVKGARQGDYNRLCRVANSPRIAADGHPLGLYTIPLTVSEMVDLTAEDLLEMSKEPRRISIPTTDRPELRVWDEYEDEESGGIVETEAKRVEEVTTDVLADQFEKFVKDALKMPCMYERLMTRNPDHDVRMNCAVLLYNCGLGVDDVQRIYQKLGWFDYDPEITRSHLEHIYNNKYRSMSCQTVQEKGLCIYEPDERPDCSTFGWTGGQTSY